MQLGAIIALVTGFILVAMLGTILIVVLRRGGNNSKPTRNRKSTRSSKKKVTFPKVGKKEVIYDFLPILPEGTEDKKVVVILSKKMADRDQVLGVKIPDSFVSAGEYDVTAYSLLSDKILICLSKADEDFWVRVYKEAPMKFKIVDVDDLESESDDSEPD